MPDQVVDLLEVLAADHHLLVDRIQVLRTAVDVGLDPELLQLLAERLRQVLDPAGALVAARLDELRDLLVRAGVQRLEREILELPLDLLHTEAVRERRVDLEGLGRDAPLLGRRERAQRAHVVEPVRELDQQDADVARHRDDHLADVLGLRELARLELELVELGQAVDDLGDVVAELAADRLERHGGVLDGVVQEPGLERRRVQPEIREDQRDRERVLDERFARQPVLPGVCLRRGLVRRLEPLEVALRVVGAHPPLERREPRGLAVGTPATRQGQPPAAPGGGLFGAGGQFIAGIHACAPVYGRPPAPPAIRRPISSGSA